MHKTKKQKKLADLRRRQQLVQLQNQATLAINSTKPSNKKQEINQVDINQIGTSISLPEQRPDIKQANLEHFSYLPADLTKILAFILTATIFQIVLFFFLNR